jgi:hypothetical protein
MQTLKINNKKPNSVYVLSDTKLRNKINNINYININIPSYNLNIDNKFNHYIFTTNNFHFMNEYKKMVRHNYHIINVQLDDILNYCEYTSNNLIITNNIIFNDKNIYINANIYDLKNLHYKKKILNIKNY